MEVAVYAVLVTVRIDPSRAQETLDDLATRVVPQAKAAPGFVRGTWFGDHDSGHAVILFDSREHAEQMTEIDGPPPEAPVQIETMKAYEVHAEA
jgi:quinol monooxygenase YgiN